MDSILFRLAMNSWYLLLFFVVLLAVFHLILIFFVKLTNNQWKRTEYVILGLTALGLITLSGDVRRWVASNHAPEMAERTKNSYHWLRETVNSTHPSYVCYNFIRSENSPPNFDDIQQEYDNACQWYKKLAATLPSEVYPPNFPKVNFTDIRLTKNIETGELIGAIEMVKQLVEAYEANRIEYEEWLQNTGRGEGEDIVFFFSPILLCIALALQITKVTADLRFDKS